MEALPEMYHRGKRFPEEPVVLGSCGAGISTGMYLSIVTKSTPLAEKEWGLSNQMTQGRFKRLVKREALAAVNRDSYLSIIEAVRFTEEKLGVHNGD